MPFFWGHFNAVSASFSQFIGSLSIYIPEETHTRSILDEIAPNMLLALHFQTNSSIYAVTQHIIMFMGSQRPVTFQWFCFDLLHVNLFSLKNLCFTMEDNSLFASIVTETLQERVSNKKEMIAEKKICNRVVSCD